MDLKNNKLLVVRLSLTMFINKYSIFRMPLLLLSKLIWLIVPLLVFISLLMALMIGKYYPLIFLFYSRSI